MPITRRMRKRITIGITDYKKWQKYADWIRAECIDVIRLGWKQNNFEEIKKCDGLILSGGEDVHPSLYGKPEYLSILDLNDIDQRRDDFEIKTIEYCLQNNLPILGICRGLQLSNVFFGGTLIPDLISEDNIRHTKERDIDKTHAVSVINGSLLRTITDHSYGIVNSAHHQAADELGNGLKISAVSDDGVIEGLEFVNPDKRAFMILVQWHPERLNDPQSPFSENIRERFLAECTAMTGKN